MTSPADDALPLLPTCTCPAPWEELVAVIEDQRLHARPAHTLYRAQCATYPGHWRLVPGQRRTT
ncbi:hypothetical protein ACH427_28180 [Streptomyces sp. NPDC020379]|uniref:hypothetical protein n=1 Tax=Streptomyces sp. NPDC020379 TaxID=3365071 RepID=UPI0037AD724A